MAAPPLTPLVSEQEYRPSRSGWISAHGRVPVSDATLRIPETPIEIPLRQLEDE
jgi:hypothetical protein